jgi:uncharacterized coiled-coil DUF342 family protein
MSKTYQKAPRVSPEVLPRYKAVSEVLAGVLTVSEAARRLKLSRNRFQSLLHRALEGLVEGLRVKQPGRPVRPEWEKALREETERLRRENERLTKQAESTDRLLSLARGVLTTRSGPRQNRGVKRAKTEGE